MMKEVRVFTVAATTPCSTRIGTHYTHHQRLATCDYK